MLATLQGQLALGLALDALQSQHNLLGGLGLLVEDRLGLTTITGLLAVITTLSLSEQRGLASLVLGDLVLGVLAALLALAVGVTGLGNVDLIIPIRVSFHILLTLGLSVPSIACVVRGHRRRGLQISLQDSSMRFWFAAAFAGGRDSKSLDNFSVNSSKSRKASRHVAEFSRGKSKGCQVRSSRACKKKLPSKMGDGTIQMCRRKSCPRAAANHRKRKGNNARRRNL